MATPLLFHSIPGLTSAEVIHLLNIQALTSIDVLWRWKFTIVASVVFFLICTLLFGTDIDYYEQLNRGGITYMGKKYTIFKSSRALLESVFNTRSLVEEGYIKFSKQSKSFCIPSFFGPSILLPISEIPLILAQKQSVIDVDTAHFDMLESDYTFLGSSVRHVKNHQDVVKGPLHRQLPSLIPAMWDEIGLAFDEILGTNAGDEKEMILFDVICKVIARATNRVFVGESLCRNEEYLDNVSQFSMDVAVGSLVIKLFPSFLKPIIGRIVTLPNRWHYWRCSKYTLPLIQKRMKIATDPINKLSGPEDCLQFLVKSAMKSEDTIENNARTISLRLMLLNFASIFPTSTILTNTVLDLTTRSAKNAFTEGLRDEIQQTQTQSEVMENGIWTQADLNKLWKMDSAIKETLRTSSPLIHALPRKVSAVNGFVLGDGSHLPKESVIGVPMYSVHHDESFYPRPYEYEAFRHLRIIEGVRNDRIGGRENFKPTISDDEQALTSTSSSKYLSFGMGIHACPGRFLASSMMKLVLIYLLENYDIESSESRPNSIFFGQAILPPTKAVVTFRRKHNI